MSSNDRSEFGMSNGLKYGLFAGIPLLIIIMIVVFIMIKKKKKAIPASAFGRRWR